MTLQAEASVPARRADLGGGGGSSTTLPQTTGGHAHMGQVDVRVILGAQGGIQRDPARRHGDDTCLHVSRVKEVLSDGAIAIPQLTVYVPVGRHVTNRGNKHGEPPRPVYSQALGGSR